MKIADILDVKRVLPDLKAQGTEEALRRLSAFMAERTPGLDGERVYQVLRDREKLGSTGVGESVAIPHGKLIGLPEVLSCFARSPEGVEFSAPDNRPARLFFVLLAPENSAGVHLKVLARVSRLFKDPAFRERLLTAEGDAEDLHRIIVEEDARY